MKSFKVKPGQLKTSDQAVKATCQHKKPCADCPWSRNAVPGWLGSSSSEQWIQEAHSDSIIPCHTLDGAQCAGAAIYRKNVCKSPRYKDVLVLPADREAVFKSPMEFKEYHEL